MRPTILTATLLALAATALVARPSPDALLERAIDYQDPRGVLLTEPHTLSFLETRPDGPDRLLPRRGEERW